jgi:enoyl-CoA hydratase
MFNGMSPRLEHVLVFDYALDMSSTAPHCLVELQGNTLVVTMNRPDARNALSAEMMSIMSDAWDRTNSDPEVKVVILTGAGGYFCAGADLKSMSSSAPSDKFESGEFDPTIIKPLLKGFRLTKPLIAAVEGPAIAGGTEILQATDIRVAGESARFGVSEPKWGLYPLGGSAVRLPRQLPYTVAADLLLTGRHIKAPEAKEIGLIGHVVPDGEALAKAHEIADMIAANGPLAVQAVLKTIRDSEGKHEDDCWKDDAAVGAAVFASEDAKEGPRAFAERRAPKFQGK